MGMIRIFCVLSSNSCRDSTVLQTALSVHTIVLSHDHYQTSYFVGSLLQVFISKKIYALTKRPFVKL